MRICAVIPAAGRGTRLGLSCPKILAPLGPGRTIWTILRDRIIKHCDHINVILSPSGMEGYSKEFQDYDNVSVSLQPEPIGMGDAVFRGYSVWKAYDVILIIWGDQVFVSDATLAEILKLHQGVTNTLGLPLAFVPQPYVEYVIGSNNKLLDVKQSREGDTCSPYGFSDVGTFVLSTNSLVSYWEKYLSVQARGARTQEINFLPFLTFLNASGWSVRINLVKDERECRGINTQEDLDYFAKLVAGEIE